jgi:TP901 family phage tail tape measure protein
VARTVRVVIEASVAGAIANVKAFQGTVKDLGSELDRAAAKHPERLNRIASTTGVLGIGMAAAFALITKATMDFDKQMSAVASVSDGGAKSLGAFREAALAAGRDTAFTATQAGQAEEELAKAGVSTADILGGALKGSLDLAAAGQMDLADAATIAAQAMNLFHLAGKDVPHIADVLAASANKSAAGMGDMGMALKQGGLVASQFGLTLEDTVGTLAAFADRALIGSDAGTSLKTMLTALANPSKQSADLMKQLGINAYDATGNFVGITKLAGQLQDQLGGLTDAQRQQALAQIFGSDAMRAASVLYDQGAAGIQGYIAAVNDSGAAQKTADEKLNNLSGDLHKLLGSLQAVAIQSSGGTSAGLRFLAQGAEHALNAFLGLPKPIQETATILLGVSAAGLLATSGLLRVKTTVTGAMQALRDLGPVGQKAATGLSAVGSIGGKLGIAGIAIFGIVEGYKALGEWMSKKYGPVHHDLTQLSLDLQRFADSGHATGLMAQVYGESLVHLAENIEKVQRTSALLAATPPKIKMGGAFAGSKIDPLRPEDRKAFEQAKANINDLDKALADLASHGSASQAKMSFDMITDSLLRQGIPMSEIIAMFPEYSKAASDASVANGQLGQGFGSVKQNADLMVNGLQDAINHGQTLLDVFKQLSGGALDWAHAEDNLFESFDKASQSVKENAGQFKNGADQLDAHTEAGRRNREALLGIVDATQQAVQAKFNETGSLEAANEVYKQGREALIAAAVAAGRTRKEAEALADQWLRMPPLASTRVETPGLSTAVSQADRANNAFDRLDGRVVSTSVNVYTTDYHSYRTGERMRWGGVAHARNGLVARSDIYTGGTPIVAFAERATKREAAFIPESGNLARSRRIADYVVGNWLGGSTSWGGRPGGGGGYVDNRTVTYQINDATDPSRVVAAIATYERSNGKNWRK